MTHKSCLSCRLPPSPEPIDLCGLTFADNIRLSLSGSFQNELGQLEPFQIVNRYAKFNKIGNLVDVDLGIDSKGRKLKFFGILFNHLDHVDLLASSAVLGTALFEFEVASPVQDGSRKKAAKVVTNVQSVNSTGISLNSAKKSISGFSIDKDTIITLSGKCNNPLTSDFCS